MIFPKIGLRNHTCFSGGENTPEEMILSAIEAGAQAIGICYPAPASFSFCAAMQSKANAAFRREIAELSQKYREKINVLQVEERDFYADPVFSPCDIRIGVVHTLVADDGAICHLDTSADQIAADVAAHFDGNFYRLVRRYYETLALIVRRTKCDLVADFDFLQTFHLEKESFDPTLPEYRAAVLDTMETLVREDVAFEIRLRDPAGGKRDRFSPAEDVVCWLASRGAKFFLSSNARRKEDLFGGFSACAQFAKVCGVGGFSFPSGGKWKTIPIGRES